MTQHKGHLGGDVVDLVLILYRPYKIGMNVIDIFLCYWYYMLPDITNTDNIYDTT